MQRFSPAQIAGFEDARVRDSLRVIEAALATGRSDGDGPRIIADFCRENAVLDPQNMAEIARAHAALGVVLPQPHTSVPLRRRGFTEEERVRAYLHALRTKKKRLVLNGPI